MNFSTPLVMLTVLVMSFSSSRFISNEITRESTGVVVHSLTFVNDASPVIVQDRTVSADKALVANWKAYVRRESDPIEMEISDRICSGSGWWNYSGGRKSAIIDFDDWVGDIGCFASLREDQVYQVCASYHWGDGQSTQQCSSGFKIDKANEN